MDTESDRSRTAWGVHIVCYLLMATVFAYVLVERYRRPLVVKDQPAIEPSRNAQVEQRIDPNTASWAELARLPGLGEGAAQDIVAYRERRRAEAGAVMTAPAVVFRSIADLDSIPGLGEKTLQRIERFLRFPE